MNLLGLSLSELLEKNIDRDEVVNFYSKRIKKNNPVLNALIATAEEKDLATNSESKSKLLKGLPLVLKDNIATVNLPTTASANVLKDYFSPYQATVTTRLLQSGATILGKTNLDAWAHGSSTETSDFGTTRNPYDLDRVPGGSSGGSAAAVAAGLAPAAIGTETAGSIRLPAAWCGVIGLKPSYGRVSRYGLVAMGSSWDCPGPITQTVEDAAILLQLIAGYDKYDGTSVNEPVPDYRHEMKKERKFTIGISDEYLKDVDREIVASVENAIKLLEKQGHKVKRVTLMSPKLAISVYMILQRAEVSSNLARYDGVRCGSDRDQFGEEAVRRILLGTHVLSAGYYDAYYKKAQKVRYLIREDFESIFSEADVIFAPTVPMVATKIGESDKYSFYGEMMDVLTEPAAAAGIPAISIPLGMHSSGLPIGGQFMGKYLDESGVLNIAHQLGKEINFDRCAVMKKYD